MFKNFTMACLSIILLTAGFMVGCKKDTTTSNRPVTYCDTAHCGAGTCDSADQICICPAGYEGYGCATEIRSKFTGTYLAIENCGGSPSTNYNFTITTSSQGVQYVTFNNFANQGYTVSASLSEQYPGSNNYAVSIGAQTVSNGTNVATFSGTGNLSGNSITLSYQYQVSGSGSFSNCGFTGTKQ